MVEQALRSSFICEVQLHHHRHHHHCLLLHRHQHRDRHRHRRHHHCRHRHRHRRLKGPPGSLSSSSHLPRRRHSLRFLKRWNFSPWFIFHTFLSKEAKNFLNFFSRKLIFIAPKTPKCRRSEAWVKECKSGSERVWKWNGKGMKLQRSCLER